MGLKVHNSKGLHLHLALRVGHKLLIAKTLCAQVYNGVHNPLSNTSQGQMGIGKFQFACQIHS